MRFAFQHMAVPLWLAAHQNPDSLEIHGHRQGRACVPTFDEGDVSCLSFAPFAAGIAGISNLGIDIEQSIRFAGVGLDEPRLA